MEIGDQIKKEKAKKRIRRKELSSESGVYRLTIKKMEDDSDGRLSYFKKIFGVFGYNKMKIVFWKETPGGKKSKKIEIEIKD